MRLTNFRLHSQKGITAIACNYHLVFYMMGISVRYLELNQLYCLNVFTISKTLNGADQF